MYWIVTGILQADTRLPILWMWKLSLSSLSNRGKNRASCVASSVIKIHHQAPSSMAGVAQIFPLLVLGPTYTYLICPADFSGDH